MKVLRLFKNSSLLKLGLGIAIIAIGYLIAMFYYQVKDLDNSVNRIAIANKSQFQLEQLLSTLSSNEASLRSFILTRDSVYLKRHLALKKQIRLRLDILRKQSLENAELRLNLIKLNAFIDRRYHLFDETMRIISRNDYDTDSLLFKLSESDKSSEVIQDFVDQLVQNESDIVGTQHEIHSVGIRDSKETATVLALLSLFIFLLSYSKMSTDIKKQKRANDELKFLNETFNNAEKTAGFGHWKLNLNTNVYTLSDNYYRLMGCKPQGFEPNLENISRFIHPDDLDMVIKAHIDSLKTRESTSIVCRYMLNNGEIKYIRSVGSFRINAKGDLVKIGVTHDVTEQYMNTIKLSENNQKLVEINTELESFNSIVSHDLQEPLRKIQMFISRLEATESETLTEKGRDYFTKIRLSANRMQNLMIDLVDYARAIKGDRIFVKTDLNGLLKEVVEELSLSIEEKNARIIVGELPVINAIPFQIQQLFVNLISNSLKYSKHDVGPIISIQEEEITESFIQDEKLIDSNGYYKIGLSDNGIGFRQEFAESIFILFKRLETEKTYDGTGLGLAICKKITDNHNGIIVAFGQPGIGAQFQIYFPK